MGLFQTNMQHKLGSTALLSGPAALTLISEPQNAFRKWDVPLEIGTAASSKEVGIQFCIHFAMWNISYVTFADAFGQWTLVMYFHVGVGASFVILSWFWSFSVSRHLLRYSK